jgi:hypothetical protein
LVLEFVGARSVAFDHVFTRTSTIGYAQFGSEESSAFAKLIRTKPVGIGHASRIGFSLFVAFDQVIFPKRSPFGPINPPLALVLRSILR